ncbi:CAP domain-containing protein [Deinococcus deserti]|uniref:Putative SCP domain protein n=1 Tax=Deinococcus deserti (strain DSM 17065 / CIP 109153 / LMG 22923 / VCD115) TaxID=546414 RepID=C1CZW9_DEIDV|nr:putative SCP domain protein precursor [Deinococcus deserti VCD115]
MRRAALTLALAAVPWSAWVQAQSSAQVSFRIAYRTDSSMAAPLQVSFQATVPAEHRVEWVFGDGAVGVGPKVSHTYYKTGTYAVRATLFDPTGRAVSRATGELNVRSSGPERAEMTVLIGRGTLRLSSAGSVAYAPGTPTFQVNGKDVGPGPVRVTEGPVDLAVRLPGQEGKILERRLSFRMASLGGSVPFETEVLRLTNRARAQGFNCATLREGGRALPPLKQQDALDVAALAQSAGMALQGYFDHTSALDGSSPLRRVQAAGLAPNVAAENIAAGQQTPEEVVGSWLRSPGHCRNIMGDFTLIGLSYVERPGTKFQRYWTQVFAKL